MDYKAQQAARDSAAQAMQAAFPKLVAVSDKNNPLIAASKNMRIQLAEAFPGIKFSVKSSRYSGGDSINVSWIDGPCAKQVDEIIKLYSAGSFDGMEDIYNYSRDAWTDAFGDAKYVFSQRSNSDKAIDSALRTIFAQYGFDGAARPSAAEFRAGRCNNVYAQGGCPFDLSTLVHQVASARTWALSKAPKAAELEEAAS